MPDGALVVARGEVVDLGAELDACDVAKMKDGAVGVRAQDDVAELLRRDETALRANGVGKLLAIGDGLAADLTGGVDVVLRGEGVDDVCGGDAELRHLVGLNPDADGVLAAEDLNAADAFDAGDLILQVDDGVVGEEVRAVFAVAAS